MENYSVIFPVSPTSRVNRSKTNNEKGTDMDTMSQLTGFGECESPKQISSPSLIDTLRRRKVGLEKDLANVTAALDALEAAPEVAKVLELVARAQ